MNRGGRVLVILALLVPLEVCAMWHAEKADPVMFRYAIGAACVVIGAALMTLHWTVSDDFLRREFGERGARQMRRFCRRGWIVSLSGLAVLGVLYCVCMIDATVAFDRGLSAAKAQDWQTAAEAFSKAIRLNPSDVRFYRQRGAAYLHQDDPDRAITDFDEALRRAPNDAPTTYNRGVACFKKRDYDQALAEFGEAIRLDPSFRLAYLARSNTYARKGDEARAKTDRQKAAELDSSPEKSAGGKP